MWLKGPERREEKGQGRWVKGGWRRTNGGEPQLSTKLLCRSLCGGRRAIICYLPRKLPDANRFVSGRFKRFTIIQRVYRNSINASSLALFSYLLTFPPPFPSFAKIFFCFFTPTAASVDRIVCRKSPRQSSKVYAKWSAKYSGEFTAVPKTSRVAHRAS